MFCLGSIEERVLGGSLIWCVLQLNPLFYCFGDSGERKRNIVEYCFVFSLGLIVGSGQVVMESLGKNRQVDQDWWMPLVQKCLPL